MEDKLTERRVSAENSFNELVKQKDQKEAEVREIDTELVRLQGEYRVIDDLLKQPKTAPDVIDATAVDKKAKK